MKEKGIKTIFAKNNYFQITSETFYKMYIPTLFRMM